MFYSNTAYARYTDRERRANNKWSRDIDDGPHGAGGYFMKVGVSVTVRNIQMKETETYSIFGDEYMG